MTTNVQNIIANHFYKKTTVYSLYLRGAVQRTAPRPNATVINLLIT